MKKLLTVIAILFGIVIVVFAMDVVLCPNCKGNGWVVTGYNYYGQIMTATCPQCGGRGVLNVNNSPSFKGAHYVHLYDDNNKDQGSYLYYSDIQKIHIGGNSYKVVPSGKRGYKYQVQGYKLYFNY